MAILLSFPLLFSPGLAAVGGPGLGKKCSNRPSAREQVEDDTDDGEDQEKMDPCANGINANYPKQPQYEQNDCDRPKHLSSPETCRQ
jgi:hypothetical protein